MILFHGYIAVILLPSKNAVLLNYIQGFPSTLKANQIAKDEKNGKGHISKIALKVGYIYLNIYDIVDTCAVYLLEITNQLLASPGHLGSLRVGSGASENRTVRQRPSYGGTGGGFI